MPKQCALITGVNGGIGQALAEVFQSHGYFVVGTDKGQKPSSSFCSAYRSMDLIEFVRDETYANTQTQELKSLFPGGELNVLINNAAIQILGGASSLTREQWQDTLDTNLLASFFLTQAFLPNLSCCDGVVLNIGSVHARLTKKDFVAYATSKAALEGMTRALAVDLGEKVRVNCISPGAIHTEMLLSGFGGDAEKLEKLAAKHPRNSIGKPSEVARLAFALVDRKLNFLSGASIPLDGAISCTLNDLT